MKEVTYGWYPSVHDIYRPKGRPSSYHLECLYKYQDSMYYQDKAKPPRPELFVRGVSSGPAPPTPEDLRRRVKSVPVPQLNFIPKLHIPTPAECWAHKRTEETKWGVVGEGTTPSPSPPSDISWPVLKDKQQFDAMKETYLTGVNQIWGPSTSVVVPPTPPSSKSHMAWPTAHPQVTSRPQTSITRSIVKEKSRPPSATTPQSAKSMTIPRPPTGKSSASSKRPSRIQSATMCRKKTDLPVRPVTADANRYSQLDNGTSYDVNALDISESPSNQLIQTHESPKPVSKGEELSSSSVPFVNDVKDVRNAESVKAEAAVASCQQTETDDYDTIVKKYGWRAQIPGDPYKLKKPMKRWGYAVQISEPQILPEPPTVHMESKETFFYNTIPKKPLSFDVSKEWMSEVLLAKRLELQKRDGGIKYNYKNFAFVY